MRKNKLLTAFALLVFVFMIAPLIIITVTAFGEGSAITFPIKSFSVKWFVKILSDFLSYQFANRPACHINRPFGGNSCGLCPGKVWYEGKRIFKICIFISYHSSRNRNRLCSLPVPCTHLTDSSLCRTFSRTLYGDSSLCNPSSWFQSGPV